MGHRGIGAVFAGLAFVSAGCAGQRLEAPNLASPAETVAANELKGTWRGETWPVGTDSTTVQNRDVTLEIKDDGTYRLTSTRAGTGTASSESGVAVGERNGVVLKSSKGQSTRLQRKGNTLHGMVDSGGKRMSIMVEKAA